MKLTDAMARGHQEMEWTTHVLENRRQQNVFSHPRQGCALGLAAVGIGASQGVEARYMKFNGQDLVSSFSSEKLWMEITTTNNECSSYEEAVLALKEKGLDEVEVELP